MNIENFKYVFLYKKIKTFLIIVMLIMSINIAAIAQQCGPACPVCSGSGKTSGAILSPKTILSSLLFIPGGEEETNVFNLRAGIISNIDIGIGYTIKTDKFLWSIRWQPITENESSLKPGIILGTGSVQIGKSDQSIFIQLTKAFEFSEVFSTRITIGTASLLPDLNKQYFIANLTMTVTDRWSPFVSYDGLSYHLGLSWIPTDWLFVSGLFLEMKYPALSVGFRHTFK